MKQCISCKVELIPDQNWYSGSQKDRYSICKNCLKERASAYYWKHKNERQESKKLLRLNSRLKRQYEITLPEFIGLILEQENKCLICNQMFGNWYGMGGNRPVPDHDHKTGQIRGILHHTCNAAIGLLSDNPEHLTRAAEYLQRK